MFTGELGELPLEDNQLVTDVLIGVELWAGDAGDGLDGLGEEIREPGRGVNGFGYFSSFSGLRANPGVSCWSLNSLNCLSESWRGVE